MDRTLQGPNTLTSWTRCDAAADERERDREMDFYRESTKSRCG